MLLVIKREFFRENQNPVRFQSLVNFAQNRSTFFQRYKLQREIKHRYRCVIDWEFAQIRTVQRHINFSAVGGDNLLAARNHSLRIIYTDNAAICRLNSMAHRKRCSAKGTTKVVTKTIRLGVTFGEIT